MAEWNTNLVARLCFFFMRVRLACSNSTLYLNPNSICILQFELYYKKKAQHRSKDIYEARITIRKLTMDHPAQDAHSCNSHAAATAIGSEVQCVKCTDHTCSTVLQPIKTTACGGLLFMNELVEHPLLADCAEELTTQSLSFQAQAQCQAEYTETWSSGSSSITNGASKQDILQVQIDLNMQTGLVTGRDHCPQFLNKAYLKPQTELVAGPLLRNEADLKAQTELVTSHNQLPFLRNEAGLKAQTRLVTGCDPLPLLRNEADLKVESKLHGCWLQPVPTIPTRSGFECAD